VSGGGCPAARCGGRASSVRRGCPAPPRRLRLDELGIENSRPCGCLSPAGKWRVRNVGSSERASHTLPPRHGVRSPLAELSHTDVREPPKPPFREDLDVIS